MQNLLKENAITYAAPVDGIDIQTIVKSRVIARNQQVCRLDRERPWPSDAIRSVERQLKRVLEQSPANLVLVSDYAKGTITQSLLDFLEETHRKCAFFLAIDPKPNRGLRYGGADLLKPNRSEALQLSGMHAVDQEPFPAHAVAQAILKEQKARYLGITLGEQGIVLVDANLKTYWEPTVAKEVFDVSGAGDTALVGLATALCVGEDPVTAAQFANLLSGIVVRKIGTATTTTDEILAFLKR
jgi:D-beta-D-heptose 7-phosphate kinase/D-beta-D-heptose 1-phosphate adenosyltransferase